MLAIRRLVSFLMHPSTCSTSVCGYLCIIGLPKSTVSPRVHISICSYILHQSCHRACVHCEHILAMNLWYYCPLMPSSQFAQIYFYRYLICFPYPNKCVSFSLIHLYFDPSASDISCAIGIIFVSKAVSLTHIYIMQTLSLIYYILLCELVYGLINNFKVLHSKFTEYAIIILLAESAWPRIVVVH